MRWKMKHKLVFVKRPQTKSVCICDAELPDRKLVAQCHQLHPPEGAAGRRNRWQPPPAAPRETTAALRSEHKVITASPLIVPVISPVEEVRVCVCVSPVSFHQCSPAPGSLTWSTWWRRFGRKSWWSYTGRGQSAPETKYSVTDWHDFPYPTVIVKCNIYSEIWLCLYLVNYWFVWFFSSSACGSMWLVFTRSGIVNHNKPNTKTQDPFHHGSDQTTHNHNLV